MIPRHAEKNDTGFFAAVLRFSDSRIKTEPEGGPVKIFIITFFIR
jgi:hypothetical protein